MRAVQINIPLVLPQEMEQFLPNDSSGTGLLAWLTRNDPTVLDVYFTECVITERDK